MTPDAEKLAALPVWGGAELPPEQAARAVDETRGFREVLRILLRAWP